MVARMMRWPWPPIMLKKVKVKVVMRGIKGVAMASPTEETAEGAGRMRAEVRWKGPKMTALSSLRRTVKRNFTKAEVVRGDSGEVDWNEEFDSVLGLTAYKLNVFQPWDIEIVVFYGFKKVFNNKASMFGSACLNLAEYTSAFGEELELYLPLSISCSDSVSQPTVHLTLQILEITCPETLESVQRPVIPASSPPSSRTVSPKKPDLSALKAGLRKVKIFKEFVSTRKLKKSYHEDEGSDGRFSASSEDTDYTLDTNSLDENLNEVEEGNEDTSIRKSFSYGTLSTANYVDGLFFSDIGYDEYDDMIYYSHRRSDVDRSLVEDASSSVPHLHTSIRSILPWKKRKYSFRSPNSKGEPLLKKAYGEEGGDDIDYDRRQLSSSDECPSLTGHRSDEDRSNHLSSISGFGDDSFVVGAWESKEITSRDGCMQLSADVFFASIDQRSESASGQSACTSLAVVIAEWFHLNDGTMPIKSQFDSLIREGSLEWRKLCNNEAYIEQFPDKHFDLETVLQSETRRLRVVPRNSFVGFFHPDGCEGNGSFDLLLGAMSFDSIWKEIATSESDCLYIVSWNDHFFVLKVEREAFYIIDTLGVRLFEGCNQAYMLKFDRNSTVRRMGGSFDGDSEIVCKGRESCKEYIKSFLASIPIRELQEDMKKGLMGSTPLHSRLQIEFHYTELAMERDGITAPASPPPCLILVSEEPSQSPDLTPQVD